MAGYGGKRPGAGRKKGSVTKRKKIWAHEAAESGMTPITYMLRVMRDTKAPVERRDEMARAAAPYIHPRLQAIDHSGKIDMSTLPDGALDLLEQFLSAIGR